MLLVQLVLFLGCIVCVAVILAPDVALLLTVIPSQQAAAALDRWRFAWFLVFTHRTPATRVDSFVLKLRISSTRGGDPLAPG
jgi:hypothetical protein